MLYPLQSISGVLGNVLFPVFSQIQDDEPRFRDSYLKVNSTIAMVTFPMMFGLWAVVDHFVFYAFGQKWEPVILLLLILVPVGMAQSIGTTVGFIYQAKGRTDWMFRWGIGSGIFVLSAFFIGIQWGIIGVATAYLVAVTIMIYPSFYVPFKLINLKVKNLLNVLARPFMCSSIMFLSASLTTSLH